MTTSLPLAPSGENLEIPPSPLLEETGRAMLLLLTQQGAALSLKDAEGRYLWANAVLAALASRAPAAWIGLTDADVFGGAFGAEVRAGDLRALGGAGVSAGEHVLDRGGQRQVFRTWRAVLPPTESRGPLVLNAWWDDSARREQAAQLQRVTEQIERQQAAFDKLVARQQEGLDRSSMLYRHDNFEEHLRRELALSSREHREFALAWLQVQGADELRRTHGVDGYHRVADMILHLLRANTRSMDMICRLGDDRFGILLSGVGLATAHTRMEQFRRQCATHLVVHEGVSMSFEVSAGVASFPHTAQTLDELGSAAGRALDEALRRGGNRVGLAAIALPVPTEPEPPAVSG